MSEDETGRLIRAFISPHLDHWKSLFTCLGQSPLDRLQMVQKPATKLLTRSSKRSRDSRFDGFSLVLIMFRRRGDHVFHTKFRNRRSVEV